MQRVPSSSCIANGIGDCRGSYRRQRARRREAPKRLGPRVTEAQQRRGRRPTHLGGRLGRIAGVDVAAHRGRRRVGAPGEVGRRLPIHHVVAVDRLTARVDRHDVDDIRRVRVRAGVSRRLQRDNGNEHQRSRSSCPAMSPLTHDVGPLRDEYQPCGSAPLTQAIGPMARLCDVKAVTCTNAKLEVVDCGEPNSRPRVSYSSTSSGAASAVRICMRVTTATSLPM